MAPRVLVDATAVPSDRGGVGRYVDGLIAGLGRAAEGAADGAGDLVVVCQRADLERYSRMAPTARVVPGPVAIAHRPARLAWEQTGLPLVAQEIGVDVVHCPHYTMPLRLGKPVVVTVHDVTFLSEPALHPGVSGNFYRSATRTSLRRAARVVVPSKATRDELVRLLDADPTMLDVAYHGVDPQLFRRPTEAEVRRISDRLRLHDRPYIGFLGALSRRKNVHNLVRGWARAVADRDDAPALVLAGSSAWDEEVDAAFAEVPPHLRALRPGYLRFGDLAGFLGGALVVAAPSMAEGFGLPVLEAMACGSAVLTTRRLSLPEVGGDAVAYTEPDADSIAQSLSDLLDNPQRRSALADAGFARSREFTWAASAEAHLASYARAAGS